MDDAEEIDINIREKDEANVYIWIYYCNMPYYFQLSLVGWQMWRYGEMEEVVNAWDQIVHCIVTLHGLLTWGEGYFIKWRITARSSECFMS